MPTDRANELAREVLSCGPWCPRHLNPQPDLPHWYGCPAHYRGAVTAAIRKAVAEEREACAGLADEWVEHWEVPAAQIAVNIRARAAETEKP